MMFEIKSGVLEIVRRNQNVSWQGGQAVEPDDNHVNNVKYLPRTPSFSSFFSSALCYASPSYFKGKIGLSLIGATLERKIERLLQPNAIGEPGNTSACRGRRKGT